MLAGAIVYFLVTRDRSIYRYIEPFWMFGFHGTHGDVDRPRRAARRDGVRQESLLPFLCARSARRSAILSNLTVFRIKRWKECNTCKICEKACEWGAIQGPKIVKSECVRCDDCERLYMDEKKCPHWIIIKRRSDFTARPSAAPAA